MENKNNLLDFLRFFAALWVTLFHLNEPIEHVDNWYRNFVKAGALGVPIFFVISGYCIAIAASRSAGSLDFLIRRFFRIYPAYWFSLIIVLFTALAFKLVTGFNYVAVFPSDLISVIATISLLTKPFSDIPTVNWVYWSLTFELFFYLIIAFSLILKKSFANIFLLAISTMSFFPYLFQFKPLFFLLHWPAFGLGIALFNFNLNNKRTYWFALLLVLVNLISLIHNTGAGSYSIMVGITFLLIFISIWFKDMPQGFFTVLGDYSYSTYLLHVPLGAFILGSMKTLEIQRNIWANILFDVGVYFIISIVAFYSFSHIEKRFIGIGKSFKKRMITSQIRL